MTENTTDCPETGQTDLMQTLLAKPVGPAIDARPSQDRLTRQVEVNGDKAEVVINAPGGSVTDDHSEALAAHGLDPAEWKTVGFTTSEWTMASGDTGISTRYKFARQAPAETRNDIGLDELIATIVPWEPAVRPVDGDHGFIVALGDMQFGKIDGDGVEGTLRRTIECIDKAADLLWTYADRFDIGHVHIAWLGDHIEGFQSQGGANVWRTPLTLNEQIRLTRRVMLHALTTFHDQAKRVSMAAVPGNHGETARFAGKGITRYDDSHDTESLIAVADAAKLNPKAFGHVEFYVPDTDELTVTVPVAGTKVLHAHGHQWRVGKHWDWWTGQAFHNPTPYAADLLVAGHLHHFFVEQEGKRMFLQVPSFESESTWWKHQKGTPGDPGLVVAITKDGRTTPLEVVR